MRFQTKRLYFATNNYNFYNIVKTGIVPKGTKVTSDISIAEKYGKTILGVNLGGGSSLVKRINGKMFVLLVDFKYKTLYEYYKQSSTFLDINFFTLL